jgi:D-lactate dehydrogenase (cytochrome)
LFNKLKYEKAISTDVCVPISKLPEILIQTKKDAELYGLKYSIVGHVGDGNFHTFISLDPNNTVEVKNYKNYTEKLVRHSLRLDGTCTGEHGIGLGTRIDYNLVQYFQYIFNYFVFERQKKVFE